MASLTVETWQCDACGKESDTKLKCCAGCRSVYYCDAKCAKIHWDNGHKKECKVMKVEKGKKKFETYSKKGNSHFFGYEFKDAKKSHKRALKVAEQIGNEKDIAESYDSIGLTYHMFM